MILGLQELDGVGKPIRLAKLVCHLLENGYSGPRAGISGSDIAFACRWLAERGEREPRDEWVVTTPMPTFYMLRKARQKEADK